MITLEAKLEVFLLDEETFKHQDTYSYTTKDAELIIDDVWRTLTGLHVIGEDGVVYVVRVRDIDG